MYNHSFASEYDLARPLALAAGEAVLHHRRRFAEGNPVRCAMEARQSANRIICDAISRACPGDALLSRDLPDSEARLRADRAWIIEALDGTDEFQEGKGGYAVMIGLTVASTPVIGIIYLPTEEVLYGAAWGAGAWIEESGSVRPLRANTTTGEQLRLLCPRYPEDPVFERMCQNLPVGARRNSGSVGLSCGSIAAGQADLYLNPHPALREWNCCAPDLILREAGGTVTDFYGEPLRYNKRNPTQPHGFIASAPGLLENVLPRVTSFFATAYAPRHQPVLTAGSALDP